MVFILFPGNPISRSKTGNGHHPGVGDCRPELLLCRAMAQDKLPSARCSFYLEHPIGLEWPLAFSLSSVMKTRGLLLSGLFRCVGLHPHSLVWSAVTQAQPCVKAFVLLSPDKIRHLRFVSRPLVAVLNLGCKPNTHPSDT